MLNYTEIEQKLKNIDFIEGSAPRWIFDGNIRRQNDLKENTSLTLLFVNTSKEVNMRLGRDFPKNKLKGNEAIITRSALRAIGIDPFSNPTLELYVNLLDLISAYFNEAKSDIDELNVEDLQAKPALKIMLESLRGIIRNTVLIDNLSLLIDLLIPETTSLTEFTQLCVEQEDNPLILRDNFNVVLSVSDPDGKWPTSLGKVMLVDNSYLLPFIIRAFSNNIRRLLPHSNIFVRICAEIILRHLQDLEEIPIEEYALITQLSLKDREWIYAESTEKRGFTIRNYIRQLATDCFGLDYSAKYEATLLASVDEIGISVILIDMIFVIVTFFLTILSVLLIYSLMMSVFYLKPLERGRKDLRVQYVTCTWA